MRSMAMEMERVRCCTGSTRRCPAALLDVDTRVWQAGMISDMVDDAIESAAPEGIDEAADEEIERVVAEITAGQFGSLAAAPTTRLPTVRLHARVVCDTLMRARPLFCCHCRYVFTL